MTNEKTQKGEEMIKIKRSKNADTRSAEKIVTKDELLKASEQHIMDVHKAMMWMTGMLYRSSTLHDYTKIDYINEFYEDFKTLQEHKDVNFKELNWYKDLHLNERHHLNDRCPDDVNMFDVMERIADITMAAMARTGEIYEDTLNPEILTRAYTNTINLLKSQIEVEEEPFRTDSLERSCEVE